MKTKKLSKRRFDVLNSKAVEQDRELIECQDHCWRIYSNYLNAVLVTPTFKSETDAADYQYQDTDEWCFDDDVNW